MIVSPLDARFYARWTKRCISISSALPRILVVDDNKPAAEGLATLLHLDGFQTAHASSGLEALREVRRFHPEVVLMDINMPRHNGIQTARVLSRLRLLDRMALIAYSALSADVFSDMAIAAGFDGYCQKRGAVEHILAMIKLVTRHSDGPTRQFL